MVLANQNDVIVEKTNTIQNDSVKVISLLDVDKDGVSFRNIKLIEKDDIQCNCLQVINQYVVENGARSNRYQRDSFWEGSGLFEYVQLFVIANVTFTRYCSNTTCNAHVKKAGELKARDSN